MLKIGLLRLNPDLGIRGRGLKTGEYAIFLPQTPPRSSNQMGQGVNTPKVRESWNFEGET